MEKLLKENILYLLIVLVIFGAGISLVAKVAVEVKENYQKLEDMKVTLEGNKTKLAQLQQRQRQEEAAKKRRAETKSGKVIYEVLGQQFSAEASFGIMFENILSNMTTSGLKIRSIDYNYHPNNDKVLTTNVPGYNACELSFTTVSNYSQLQTFFKNLAKEKYLSSLYEVYIEPYDKDKTILITRFKIRIYTKTI